MARPGLPPADPSPQGERRLALRDDLAALYGLFTAPQAAAQLEEQELRQLVHRALADLTPDELRVVELRYQHKRSPGQVASRLGMAPRRLRALETQALRKIRAHLQAWKDGS